MIFQFLFSKLKNTKASLPIQLRKDIHTSDRAFSFLLHLLCYLVIFTFCGIFILIFTHSLEAFKKFGFAFFFTSEWDSWKEQFGALSLIWGTLVSSLIALIIAVPISLSVALFLNELAPKWVVKILGFIVEMLAAIPSIVYGLWGFLVLAPFLQHPIQHFLNEYLSFLPFFRGNNYGVGMLCGGIILSFMIIPTISSLCKEVFRSIPQTNREAVLAIGATKWEMIYIAVLKGGKGGIIGAIIMGMGRALGETMAVTMVIGNKPNISLSLFDPAQTMASILANQYAEADNSLHLSSLSAIAMTLFITSLIVSSFSFLLTNSPRKRLRKTNNV